MKVWSRLLTISALILGETHDDVQTQPGCHRRLGRHGRVSILPTATARSFELRRRMGGSARLLAENKYTWDHQAGEVEAVLRDVVESLAARKGQPTGKESQ